MKKRPYMVIFYSKGPRRDALCQMCRRTVADGGHGAGVYEGIVWHYNPDDAMTMVADNYCGVRVRHCYLVDEEQL